MNKPPSSPSWPAWLLFAFIVIGPPSAIVTFFPTVTRNPFIAGGLLLVYEVLVGLGTVIQAVIKKTWERRGDAWVDAGASRLERVLRLFFASAGRRYSEFFRYEHSDLDMKGISTRGTYTLDLEQVFVEVRIDPIPAHRASSDPIHLPSALSSGPHDIWEYLIYLDQHLVILGAPGSGKTTLLKHLGLCLIQDRRRRKARARKLPWTVPLFLPLREHSAQLRDQPDYGLVEAANMQIRKWKQDIPSEWIERQLQKGHCLVLLDGLDEIADPAQRQQMVIWVQSQMLAYPKNRFIITSRPLGYQTNPLDRVTVLDVQSFTFEQITRFLQSWYLANEIKRAVRDDPGVRMRADAGSEDLLKRLRTTSALFAMAANPLLLTMIATVHLYYGQLPGARITLYKAICEVFLSRRAEMSNGSKELRAEQRQLVLQPLAYTLMQQGKREISREEACSILGTPLQLVDKTLTPQDFLDHLEAICSGLLLEREQGVYGFAHQTFQEYLAMIHMQEHHLEPELLSHVEESWWHETILLFCAQADATAVLEACIDRSLSSLEAITLAIDSVEEARTVKSEVKERFYALLEQGVNDVDPKRRQVIAEALLKRRLRQMHPLQEGIFVDTSLVTCAEYQLFLNEQGLFGNNNAPDTWNGQTFPQSQGRNPVLGVRLEDAKAFCRWLTERDHEGQSYRLPRREERQQIRASVEAGLPENTGYWEEGTFVWSRTGPSLSAQKQVFAALAIDLASVRARALAIDRDLTSANTHDLTSANTHDLTSANTHDLTKVLASTHYRASLCASALDRVRSLDLDIDHDLNRDRTNALDLTSNLNRASASTHNLASNFTCSSALDLAHFLDRACSSALALTRSLEQVRAFDLDSSLNSALKNASGLDHDLDRALALAIDIYAVIFLFVQRPEGMLPAYEGILLIKERKSETLHAPGN